MCARTHPPTAHTNFDMINLLHTQIKIIVYVKRNYWKHTEFIYFLAQRNRIPASCQPTSTFLNSHSMPWSPFCTELNETQYRGMKCKFGERISLLGSGQQKSVPKRYNGNADRWRMGKFYGDRNRLLHLKVLKDNMPWLFIIINGLLLFGGARRCQLNVQFMCTSVIWW